MTENGSSDNRHLEENERLRKVLRFYGDHLNHRGVGISAVYNDRGDRARAVLGACVPCKGRGWVVTGRKIMDQDGPYEETKTCSDCRGSGIPNPKEATP